MELDSGGVLILSSDDDDDWEMRDYDGAFCSFLLKMFVYLAIKRYQAF